MQPAPAAAPKLPPGISFVCMGSASVNDSAREGNPLSSICVMHDGAPLLLVGLGPGVLHSCLERLPSLPSAVFLPSMRLASAFDLQPYLLLAAERRMQVRVFAASEVIDRVVDNLLDVEFTEELGECAEFLEVAPGVPTEIRPAAAQPARPRKASASKQRKSGSREKSEGGNPEDAEEENADDQADDNEEQEDAVPSDPFTIVVCECSSGLTDDDLSSAAGSSESRGYNLTLLHNDAPAVCILEGPPVTAQLDDFALALRSAPAVVVSRWRSCRVGQLSGFLDLTAQNIYTLQGYRGSLRRSLVGVPMPIVGTVELQTGDAVALVADLTQADEEGGGGVAIDVRTPCVLLPQIALSAKARAALLQATKKKQQQLLQSPPARPAWNDDTSSPTLQQRRSESPPVTAGGIVERPDSLVRGEQQRLLPVSRSARLAMAPPQANEQWMAQWAAQHSGRFEEQVGGFTYAGMVPKHALRGNVFAAPPPPPKKLFLFDYSAKRAAPVALVVHPTWSLAVVLRKVSALTGIQPIAQLVTLETGYIRSPTELVHLQQVLVLRHGGKPFSVFDLPSTMSLPLREDWLDEMMPEAAI